MKILTKELRNNIVIIQKIFVMILRLKKHILVRTFKSVKILQLI